MAGAGGRNITQQVVSVHPWTSDIVRGIGGTGWLHDVRGYVPDVLGCRVETKSPLQIASCGSCVARIRSNSVNSEFPGSPFQEHLQDKLAGTSARWRGRAATAMLPRHQRPVRGEFRERRQQSHG